MYERISRWQKSFAVVVPGQLPPQPDEDDDVAADDQDVGDVERKERGKYDEPVRLVVVSEMMKFIVQVKTGALVQW